MEDKSTNQENAGACAPGQPLTYYSGIPSYKSHKTVQAAKIAAIREHGGHCDGPGHEALNDHGATLTLEGCRREQFEVSEEFMRKHKPQVGGYLVLYEDDYQSFSPAEAFESGYTLVDHIGKGAPVFNVEFIARTAHAANREYCRSIGDYSQPEWDDAPAWQRESAIAGVLAIESGKVSKPEDSHVSWLAQKEADGWKYGPVKDAEKKEHPCMVPHDQLPKEQQYKDVLFFAIVTALLHA